jgi:alpha-tubulin suppressor-like RCC1 family protein
MRIKTTLLLLIISQAVIAQCYTGVNTYGTSHIALQTDGTLWAWGSNSYGILGLGSGNNTMFPLTQIESADDWSDNYSVSAHVVALKTNGTLWTWGRNVNGECGNGNWGAFEMVTSPQQIGTDTWISVAAATYHSLAIKSDGTLWGWGSNDHNELGIANTAMQTIPVQVGTDQNWAKVYTAFDFSLAIKTDGSLWSWGSGNYFRLGQSTGSETPQRVGTANDWSSISPSFLTVFAVKTNGTLWGWGSNYQQDVYEALYGNGNPEADTNNYENGPVRIGTDNDWDMVCTNSNNTFALKTDGSLWGWGKNQNGQLGDGTMVTKYSPVQLGAETSWENLGNTVGLLWYAIKNHSLYRWGNGTSVIVPTLYSSGCTLGTDGFQNDSSFSIAPNPVTDSFQFECDLKQPSAPKIELYNNLGQLVLQKQYPEMSGHYQEYISFHEFSAGIYYLKFIANNEVQLEKIIKN